MAGEIEHFWNKINSNGFDKRPWDAGRPRKLFSTVNTELKAKGIEPLTREQLIDAYSLVFNSTEEELKEMALDKNIPFALRIIILELSDKKNRAKALADYRDYMFWKALQRQEIDWDINITSIKVKLPDEIEETQKEEEK